MFSIKQWIQTAILVSFSGLYAQPPLEEGASFNPDLPNPDLVRTDNSYIREILNKMASKGDQYITDNNIREKQIVVITVLSASEVDAKKLDISDGMIEFLPNEFIDNPPRYFYTVKVHGEMLAIHFQKTIDNLLSKLSENKRPPYVFIFSHQIPCAGLTHVHYSCAEELANLGRVNKDRYKIIVGYRAVWKDCDKELALQLLQEGGIHTSMDISSGQVLHNHLNIPLSIYQEHLYNCLTTLTRMQSNSAACVINTVTKSCTSGNELYGYMTQYSKAVMHECVEEYVKRLTLEPYVLYCSLNTLPRTVRLMLGRPTSMSEASWTSTPDDLNWNELYRNVPDSSPQEFPSFSDSLDKLESMRTKCAVDKKNTEKKGSHLKSRHRQERLEDLLRNIKSKKERIQTREQANKVNTRD